MGPQERWEGGEAAGGKCGRASGLVSVSAFGSRESIAGAASASWLFGFLLAFSLRARGLLAGRQLGRQVVGIRRLGIELEDFLDRCGDFRAVASGTSRAKPIAQSTFFERP